MKAFKWPRLHKEVELKLDNCPPTFDVTKIGKIPIEEIDEGIRTMEGINGIE